jgi:hypothetical protein
MVIVMTDISIEGDRLVAVIHGLDCLWTCRRRIVVPLAHVKNARVDPHLEEEGPWLGAGRTDALLDTDDMSSGMCITRSARSPSTSRTSRSVGWCSRWRILLR